MSIGVGVIGAGTVGGGVIETLLANSGVVADKTGADVALRHVAELDAALLNAFDLDGITTSHDAGALIADPEVDVVCELIGGVEPAKTFILQALNAGKHVVTANKMLLAMAGPELAAAAVEAGLYRVVAGAVWQPGVAAGAVRLAGARAFSRSRRQILKTMAWARIRFEKAGLGSN